jgi:hypothetical protein
LHAQGNAASWVKLTLLLEEYLDGPEVNGWRYPADGSRESLGLAEHEGTWQS